MKREDNMPRCTCPPGGDIHLPECPVQDLYIANGRLKPTAEDGYAGARYLRETPFASVTEWRRAMHAAVPDNERCKDCGGTGADVILASNGGVGEVVACWPCGGTGKRFNAR